MERHLPIARREQLVVTELGDELLIYDLRAHQAHCLNRTAALVWQHCDGRRDIPALAQTLTRVLPFTVDEDMIRLALRQLSRRKLLAAPLAPALMPESGTAQISRRVMMRRLGVAAAIALPLVTSIVAPTPAEAQSGCNAANCPPPQCCVAGLCLPADECSI